jgi:hypothetical protein
LVSSTFHEPMQQVEGEEFCSTTVSLGAATIRKVLQCPNKYIHYGTHYFSAISLKDESANVDICLKELAKNLRIYLFPVA